MFEKIKRFNQYLLVNLLYKMGIITIENLVYRYQDKKIHVNLMNNLQGIIYTEISEDGKSVIKMDVLDHRNTIIEKDCLYHGDNSFYNKISYKYPNYLNGIYFEEEETYYIKYYTVIGYITIS